MNWIELIWTKPLMFARDRLSKWRAFLAFLSKAGLPIPPWRACLIWEDFVLSSAKSTMEELDDESAKSSIILSDRVDVYSKLVNSKPISARLLEFLQFFFTLLISLRKDTSSISRSISLETNIQWISGAWYGYCSRQMPTWHTFYEIKRQKKLFWSWIFLFSRKLRLSIE